MTKGAGVASGAEMSLTIHQGTTFTMNASVKTSEGTAVNLTGKTLVFSSDVEPDFHISTDDEDSGFEITNAAQGLAVLTIPVATTRGFTPGPQYQYEIELWDGDTETVIGSGKLTVIRGVNSDQA